MKVFFFYAGTPTPILETELELVRKHERLGDNVRLLQCSGNLPNCHWNQTHDNLRCAVCRSKFNNGWNILKPADNVELKQFPKVQPADFNRLPDFESVEDIKRYRHDGENIGFGVASGLISILRDHRFDTKLHRKEIALELRTTLHVYETLKQEFQNFSPDRVYIFNGRIGTHLPAYLLCKRMGIEFYSYEIANKNGCYRLLKNATVHEPISTSEIGAIRSGWTSEKQEIGEAVLRQKRMGKHLPKVPVFTAQQKRGLLPVELDPNKRNIAIFTGTIDEYAGIEGWTSSIYQPDETAGVRRILESFETDDRFFFHLRVHPHMKEVSRTTSQLMDIRELESRFRNVRVIWPHEEIDSYALMEVCEKTLTFGSTMGLEATYWGKPSILAGRAFYEKLDCTYTPATHAELTALLKAALDPRPAPPAIMYFYWEVSEGIPFTWFKETGVRNGLATSTFDGVEIKPDALPELVSEFSRFLRGATKAFINPSKAWLMLKRYAKTIH